MPELRHDTTTPRQGHHLELHDAIQRLDEVIKHLDELIDQVRGPSNEKTVQCVDERKQPVIYLADVLAGGSAAINGKVGSLHERIDQLEQLLF